jgi:hypothetical protein
MNHPTSDPENNLEQNLSKYMRQIESEDQVDAKSERFLIGIRLKVKSWWVSVSETTEAATTGTTLAVTSLASTGAR